MDKSTELKILASIESGKGLAEAAETLTRAIDFDADIFTRLLLASKLHELAEEIGYLREELKPR